MRLAIYTENYDRGGLDTFIATLVNNWPDRNTVFTLICNHDHPGLEDIKARLRRPVTVITHDIATFSSLALKTCGRPLPDLLRKLATPLIKYLYLASAILKLRPLLCNGRYDRLVVVNGGYPGGDTCRAAGIAWGLFSGAPASIHNFHNLSLPPRSLLRLQENLVDKLLSRYTQAFVTVSHAAAASMRFRSIPPDKIRYIYNGIEAPDAHVQTSDIRQELHISPAAPLCVMLASYHPRKGHTLLLEAFRRVVDALPEARLLICGYGTASEKNHVRNLTEQLELREQVYLSDFRSDAMELLAQADLLAVASQEFESFGLTCVEAMARKIPVVATDVGGLPEVVENRQGGYCVSRDDVAQYAAVLLRLLADPEERAQQGRLGFERYQRFFTAERMSAEYAGLLQDDTPNHRESTR